MQNQDASGGKGMLSSLSLQILLYFDGWFTIGYLFASLLLYVYKAHNFFYPAGAVELEVAMVVMLAVLSWFRLFLASKGNKNEHNSSLLWSLIVAAPSAVAFAFFLTLQTYVLHVDVLVNGLALGFVSLEALLTLGTMFRFHNALRG